MQQQQHIAIPVQVLPSSPFKRATEDEVHMAMNQVLLNSNIRSPNYYSLAYEGGLRWTMMGENAEYIAVSLPAYRTHIHIEMIGPYSAFVTLQLSHCRTVLDVIREGFVELLTKVNTLRTNPQPPQPPLMQDDEDGEYLPMDYQLFDTTGYHVDFTVKYRRVPEPVAYPSINDVYGMYIPAHYGS